MADTEKKIRWDNLRRRKMVLDLESIDEFVNVKKFSALDMYRTIVMALNYQGKTIYNLERQLMNLNTDFNVLLASKDPNNEKKPQRPKKIDEKKVDPLQVENRFSGLEDMEDDDEDGPRGYDD